MFTFLLLASEAPVTTPDTQDLNAPTVAADASLDTVAQNTPAFKDPVAEIPADVEASAVQNEEFDKFADLRRLLKTQEESFANSLENVRKVHEYHINAILGHLKEICQLQFVIDDQTTKFFENH